MEVELTAWGPALELAWRGGYEAWLAAAILKGCCCLPASPFLGPLRAIPTAFRPSSAFECYLILGKLLNASGLTF